MPSPRPRYLDTGAVSWSHHIGGRPLRASPDNFERARTSRHALFRIELAMASTTAARLAEATMRHMACRHDP